MSIIQTEPSQRNGRAVAPSVHVWADTTTLPEFRIDTASGGADSFDLLTGSALPLPALVGDGSRSERATRLLFERTRAKRPALLARRVESIKAQGGRGKRGELIDKVHRAAVLLLHGEQID